VSSRAQPCQASYLYPVQAPTLRWGFCAALLANRHLSHDSEIQAIFLVIWLVTWSATRRRFALHFLPCACSYPHQQAHQAEHLWNRFLPADNAVTVGCKMVKFQPRAHWHTHPRRRAPTCCASPASRLLRGARPTRTPVSATTSPASGQSGAASAAMSLASRTLRWARIMASFPAQSTHSTVAYAPYCRAHTTAAMSLALRTRCSGHAHRGLVLRAVDTQLHMLYRRAHD